MEYTERILLLLYFPQFQSPNNSRFQSLFASMKKTENTKDKLKSRNSYNIYPEKIIRNEDKRTSITSHNLFHKDDWISLTILNLIQSKHNLLIIKGIPTSMAKSEIRSLVDKYGNINYLYVITSSIYNYSIAFINVINYKSIIPLFMNLRNFRIEQSGIKYNLKIMYSIVQGKQELKKYMKNRKIFNF